MENTKGSTLRKRIALATFAVMSVAAPVAPAAATPLASLGSPTSPAAHTDRWLAPAATSQAGTTWTTLDVAPGVQVRTGTVLADATPSWTVTVKHPVTSRLTAAPADSEVGTYAWAADTSTRLAAAGFTPRSETVSWPNYTDTPHGTVGVRVRIGSYTTQSAAVTAAKAVIAAGFHAGAEWTGYDADQPADVEHIHVAVIDPALFTGTVQGTHDGTVAQRETTSSVAAKLGSLVGVNGGFFVIADDADADTHAGDSGVDGTQAGLGAYDGQLQSLSAGSRAALVLADGGRKPRIADLSATATASAGGSHYDVQGINRVPGIVRDCGRPGALPSDRPWQDVTCSEPDDLVLFTPAYGADLPTGTGVQTVLDTSGRVLSTGGRGGRVPAGGTVLQGVGAGADWLTAHATTGTPVAVTEDVRDSAGLQVPLGPNDSIVSAAPTLLKNGRIAIDAAAEGVIDPQDLSFGFAWANTRQPRTMAGIDVHGRLYLVTVDGRQTGGSEGFTLQEAAAFMQSLGAVQALNLDGGGSTTMAVDGVLANHPSDPTGERPVGDTIQVLPPTG
jgi:hypothetical protein